ncbi:hypothetical protein AMECASPLE_027789 [Ameca splendens]|uniref:Uncharacterized protein n=1 Tax=Ameca splendens TaxID=208324 RepID=A0ABV0YSC6_9TELE
MTEWLSLLSALDCTHIRTRYLLASLRFICVRCVHQLQRKGAQAPPLHSQGYLSSLYTQKCKSKHLLSAASLSSQVSLLPSSMLPRIGLLTVVRIGSFTVSALPCLQ